MTTALTILGWVWFLSLLVMVGCFLGAEEEPREITAGDVYRAAKAKRDGLRPTSWRGEIGRA